MVEHAIVYAVGATFYLWAGFNHRVLRYPLLMIAFHLWVIVLRQGLVLFDWGAWVNWHEVHVWTMRLVAAVCIAHIYFRLSTRPGGRHV